MVAQNFTYVLQTMGHTALVQGLGHDTFKDRGFKQGQFVKDIDQLLLSMKTARHPGSRKFQEGTRYNTHDSP